VINDRGLGGQLPHKYSSLIRGHLLGSERKLIPTLEASKLSSVLKVEQ
jgi:hypothetical protein